MSSVYVKGGTWTNVEDEILKAAVSKYGLNQWSRVSSLLTKKTAKQAKARWNEWLNPLINKSDWTREEDEKLLNLVKLLPNQWRSIGPIMGRTATNCIERYQKLLEDELSDDNEDLKFSGPGIESMEASGSKGGLDLNPEGAPAESDDDEISDDDREMLYEAKARLVNTKGKRAKRKEREKMLQETKRISLLQKRRELKAAGIKVSLTSRNKKSSKEMDYNADIPFEQTPSVGLYDIEDEEQENLQDTKDFEKNVTKQGLELEKKKDEERKTNKKPEKRKASSIEGNEEIYDQRKKVQLSMPIVQEVNNYEQNDLTGVFSQPEKREEDIEDRISNVMKDIIQQQNRKSTLLGDSTTKVAKETMNPKQLTKYIRNLLKSSFETIPKPRNEYQVMPKFDEGEEEIKLVKESEVKQEQERLNALELLRQVEEEKALLRRSQVVQRGLSIPHPLKLKNIDPSGLSSLDKLIVEEFQKLIKSDYKKYVDNQLSVDEVDDLDEESYDQVQQEIKAILSTSSKKEVSIDVKIDYSKKQIQQALKEENTKITPLVNEYNERYPEISPLQIETIKQLVDQLMDQQSQIKLYQQIAKMEEIAIKNRTESLNSFVDFVTTKEGQLTDYIRSKRD